jgi:uncharacterized protein YcbX
MAYNIKIAATRGENPGKLTSSMKITKLMNYPVAGMSGHQVSELVVTPHFIVGNRLFTVVKVSQLETWVAAADEQYPLRLTQVTVPRLALFTAEDDKGSLRLKYQDEVLLTELSLKVEATLLPFLDGTAAKNKDFSLEKGLKKFTWPLRVSRRSSTARWAVDCGDEAAAWLSERLGDSVRLFKAVAAPDSAKYHFTWYTDLHLISQASLNALSEEVGKTLTADRFRANIEIDGEQPFVEMSVQKMSIGSSEFVVAPCERCGYIAVDPTLGASLDPQVVITVTKNHAGNFGLYLKTNAERTVIKLGDQVRLGI